jgi:hypothetical protein
MRETGAYLGGCVPFSGGGIWVGAAFLFVYIYGGEKNCLLHRRPTFELAAKKQNSCGRDYVKFQRRSSFVIKIAKLLLLC